MPSGYGKRCEQCYRRALLEKRIQIDCALFAKPAMAELFRMFGQWLGQEVGFQKASLTIHRYLEFFAEIETRWGSVPDAGSLLDYFGTLGLRRRALPMRFLAAVGSVEIDAQSKRLASETRRIEAIINGAQKGSAAQQLLTSYRAYLETRGDKAVSARAVRMALRPAADLLERAHLAGRIQVSQDDLNAYLDEVPGQRAAVSGFVGFLRAHYDIDLILPAKRVRAARKRHAPIEAELVELLQSTATGRMHDRRLLAAALAHFHGLPKSTLEKIAHENIEVLPDGQGVALGWQGKRYWLPGDFAASATRYTLPGKQRPRRFG